MELPIIDNCDDCGACCMDAGLPPFTGSEIDSLPDEIQHDEPWTKHALCLVGL